MSHMIDISGQKFGKLTVLYHDDDYAGMEAHWICRCDCGTVKSFRGSHLRSGVTKSCGCGKKTRLMPYEPKKMPSEITQKYGCHDCADLRECNQVYRKTGKIYCLYSEEFKPYHNYRDYAQEAEENIFKVVSRFPED